jgi:hypothetical protein
MTFVKMDACTGQQIPNSRMEHNYVGVAATLNFCKNYSIMTFVKVDACTGQQLRNSRMQT